VTSEAATAAALSAVLLQVTPENVLEVRRVVLDAADRLKSYLTTNLLTAEYVGLCGGDPVSEQARLAFSDRISQITANVSMFGLQLLRAGDQLTSIAEAYGFAEGELAASFTSFDAGWRR
jgi:hypothetical protein